MWAVPNTLSATPVLTQFAQNLASTLPQTVKAVLPSFVGSSLVNLIQKKEPHVRNFPARNSNFIGAWDFVVLSAGKPRMPIKFLVLGGKQGTTQPRPRPFLSSSRGAPFFIYWGKRKHKDFSSDVPSNAVLVWHQMQNFLGKLWFPDFRREVPIYFFGCGDFPMTLG